MDTVSVEKRKETATSFANLGRDGFFDFICVRFVCQPTAICFIFA